MSQFIEIFYGMETTPVKDYIDDSFPGEWGTEDKDGNGVKVIRTTNFTNSGKLNLADVVTRSIEDRKVVRKQIKKYDTILERSGGTADNPVGRVVLFEEDNLFLCNNFTQVLRFKDVDPRFAFYALYYFYQTNRTAIRSMGSKTTGIQNLNMSKYLEIGIPNASDEDQKAFVTIAEQADKSEFVGCKSQFIEMYYNTHNKQTLESVCPIMNKGITPKYVESSSVLVINQACIHWDGQRLGNIKYHNEEIPVRKRILESGDVLLNATGNGTLGRCCVFICPSDNNTYINDGHVIALSTDRAVILPEVLNTYLSLNDTQAEIYRQYVTGSTNQVDIVFSDIKKMKVPVPSMDEQILFVEVLTQADKSEFVGCKSQFIEIFYGMETTPVKDYIDDSFPGEWGTEDKDGNGVKVIRTTNFTNSGKLNLADVVTRSIEDRKVVRKQIKKYDTILERSGGTADNPVGRVVLFEEDNLFLCNNFTQVLRFKDVDPRFAFYALYYFYQTNRTAIRSMGSKTTGIQNLNMSKYLEIGIPNASDEDQKAFVTIAEQADKSEFVGCKSQFIEMYYNTHNKQTLESVCPIMNKGITPKYVESSSVLVINQACIHWDGQRLGNIKYHNEEIPVRKRILESGDVLLNATGNGTLGRCCVFICPSDNNTYINDGHVIALSTDRAVILPEVLNTYLSLNDTQAEIYRQYVTGSTNQVDIVFSDIKKMKVPVPSMDEQILFVEVLTQADKSEYYN